MDLQRPILAVRQKIEAACRKVRRDPREILLVAVTKTRPIDLINSLYPLGLTHIGENRVQELEQKAPYFTHPYTIHTIGHLQKNKVRKVVPLIHWIHSIDSVELALLIEQEAQKRQKSLQGLLQVNIAREPQKHGFDPDQLADVLPALSSLHSLCLQGLMTLAPQVEDPEKTRPVFRALRELRDRLQPLCPSTVSLQHLSMGMSQDYPVALEEGATILRLGSALFDVRG